MGDGGAAAAREAPAGQAATQGHVLPPEASDAGEWNQMNSEEGLLFQSIKKYYCIILVFLYIMVYWNSVLHHRGIRSLSTQNFGKIRVG